MAFDTPTRIATDRREERAFRGDEIARFGKVVHFRARQIHSATVLGDRLRIEQESGALIYEAARFLRQLDGGDEAA